MTLDPSLDALNQVLRDRIEDLAIALLGEPNRAMSNRTQLRFGNKGSKRVWIAGPKKGGWADFGGDAKGRALGLIIQERHCSPSDAIIWATAWAGLAADTVYIAPALSKSEPRFDADQLAGIVEARAWWSQSIPIEDTVAETYLSQIRKIPAPLAGWPSSVVRYHASLRSLILAATLSDGTVQAIQRVRLGPDGRKADVAAPKLSRGPQDGAYIRLPGNRTGPLQIAEGPETGLTVWRATGHETWIALGSVAKIDLPTGRRILVCADDDNRIGSKAKTNTAYTTLRKAMKKWRKVGLNVIEVYPWPTRRQDKSDFNDLVQASGIDAVQSRIEQVSNPVAPTVKRLMAAQARVSLAKVIGEFVGKAIEWVPPAKNEQPRPPPVDAIKVTVGAGKSYAARAGIVSLLTQLRSADDDRGVGMQVPTLKHAEEQVELLNAMPEAKAIGLIARVSRGRAAPDPNARDKAMCLDLDRVNDARAGMVASVSNACCEQADPEGTMIRCPFFYRCGYQAERRLDADVWVSAHERIYSETPAHFGKLAAVIIDESAWQDGLKGVDALHPITLTLGSLVEHDDVPGDANASQRLRYLRSIVVGVLSWATSGPLLRAKFLITGLTAASAIEARGLEWRRKIPTKMHPGMTRDERKEAVEAAAGNATISRLSTLWDAIEDLLSDTGPAQSGWANMDVNDTPDGQVHVLRLMGRQEVRKGWQVPTLIIDAVLRVDLIRPLWPQVRLVADLDVEAPHQRVRQVMDKSYSKAMLTPFTEDRANADPDGARAVTRNLRKLHDLITLLARQAAPLRVLIVMQKAVEAAIIALAQLPPNAVTAHHNNVAGRDEWKDVRLIIAVGRTQPSPDAVSKIASALTGEWVAPVEGWYDRADIVRETVAGSVMGNADRHPHPIGEQVRLSICEDEQVQILGRGRGVNRTAATPLDVLVLSDIPLAVPVDETLSADDLILSTAEIMQVRSGIALENPAHAFRVYHPGIWVGMNLEGVRTAFRRDKERSGSFSNKKLLIGERPTPLGKVIYQVAGPGQKPTTADYDPQMIPDPTAWLTERLGKLASCTITAPVIEAPIPSLVFEMPVPQPANDQEVEPIALGRAIPTDDAYKAWCLAQPAEATIQVGVDPSTFYRRGVLELPPAHFVTFRGKERAVLAEVDIPDFGPFMGFSPGADAARRPLLLMTHPWSGTPAPAPFLRNTPVPASNRNGPVPMSA